MGLIGDEQPAIYRVLDTAGLSHGKSMQSYLCMMAVRLLELRRVLKDTGSIYLHCDPTASHYLKLLMDAVFGSGLFLNEMTWKRSSAHSDTRQGMRRAGKIRDVVLVYTKTEGYVWNPQYMPYTEDYLQAEYRHVARQGRRYKETDVTAAKPGGDTKYAWHVKRPLDRKTRWSADLADEYLDPQPGWEYKAVNPYRGRIADRPQFQRMLDEASKPEAPFQEILVWKFSRFTRKREHAVAFKSMLRRRGVRVVSITEQADDTPTGKLLEAIIESVDEFYSENLVQEVTRVMREAASRGFWVTSYAPYGYRKVYVQDGVKKRPKLELDPPADAVARRIFDTVLQGSSILDVTEALNAEGVASPRGKHWFKTTVHNVLLNEAYTGTLVWGTTARDGAPPVRVEDAHPAIVSKRQFRRVNKLLGSRAPKKVHPRRAASPTCSAASSGVRPAARPSPLPRPRAASTPTTSATPCLSAAAAPARPPGSTPRPSRSSSTMKFGPISSPSPTSATC